MTGRPLTERERYVLQRIALGDTYRQTAHALGITEDSVQARGERARRALGARSTTHAVVLALDAGLIHPHSCGDVRTYRWHLRHGEEPDPGCREAEAAYQRDWRRKRSSAPTAS